MRGGGKGGGRKKAIGLSGEREKLSHLPMFREGEGASFLCRGEKGERGFGKGGKKKKVEFGRRGGGSLEEIARISAEGKDLHLQRGNSQKMGEGEFIFK